MQVVWQARCFLPPCKNGEESKDVGDYASRQGSTKVVKRQWFHKKPACYVESENANKTQTTATFKQEQGEAEWSTKLDTAVLHMGRVGQARVIHARGHEDDLHDGSSGRA